MKFASFVLTFTLLDPFKFIIVTQQFYLDSALVHFFFQICRPLMTKLSKEKQFIVVC